MQENEVIKFSLTDATISELSEQYKVLTCQGPGGYESVKEARNVMRSHRKGIEDYRLERSRMLIAMQKSDKAEGDRIQALIEPIESQLNAKLKVVDDKKKAEKAERERIEAERITKIQTLIDADLTLHYNQVHHHPIDELQEKINHLINYEIKLDVFQEFMDEALAKHAESMSTIKEMIQSELNHQRELREQKEREEAAEKQRQENEAKEKELEEKQRAIDEANAVKQAELDEKQKKIDEEFQRNADQLAEQQRKIDKDAAQVEAEKQRIQDEKDEAERVEKQRIGREKFEKEAEERAAQKAKDDTEREAKEKELAEIKAKEDEEQRLRNMSDADFLEAYIVTVKNHGYPTFPENQILTEDIRALHFQFMLSMADIVSELKEDIVVSG